MSSRIGKGPWARALGAVLVPDDSTPEAIRGEELWRHGGVAELRFDVGQISAHVDGLALTVTAATIPPRIWAAVKSYARSRGVLERAVAGDAQAVQLEHLLAQDWEQSLVPPRAALAMSEASATCAAAMAYAIAQAIDDDPSRLLVWRGWRPAEDLDAAADLPRASRGADWRGGVPPVLDRGAVGARESVLKRLGRSGIAVGSDDLSGALVSAYDALARERS